MPSRAGPMAQEVAKMRPLPSRQKSSPLVPRSMKKVFSVLPASWHNARDPTRSPPMKALSTGRAVTSVRQSGLKPADSGCRPGKSLVLAVYGYLPRGAVSMPRSR